MIGLTISSCSRCNTAILEMSAEVAPVQSEGRIVSLQARTQPEPAETSDLGPFVCKTCREFLNFWIVFNEGIASVIAEETQNHLLEFPEFTIFLGSIIYQDLGCPEKIQGWTVKSSVEIDQQVGGPFGGHIEIGECDHALDAEEKLFDPEYL